MGGRSFTSSNKHIQNKVGNFQVSQKKKTNHTTASWQHCQAAFSNGTLNRGEAQSPPSFFPSFPPSSFLKTRNHVVKCCFVFYPSFRLQLQPFYPINPSPPLKKKIRATWELIMDEKAHFCSPQNTNSNEVQLFWQTHFLYFRKFFTGKKCNNVLAWMTCLNQ